MTEYRNRSGGRRRDGERAQFREADETRLEGRNAVLEALRSGRTIDKLFILKGEREGSLQRIFAIAREQRVVISEVERAKLDDMSQTGAHQGVIAQCAAVAYCQVEEILQLARERGEAPFVILCDEINDPHNLGAIIRTAEGAGAHGVIIPKRRSVGLTSTVAKAAAGALEHMPIARVASLDRTIELLKQEGLWVFGADMDGQDDYYRMDLKGPIALVVGSEGFGMGHLIQKKCDFLVKIPMCGEINSLNASVAAGILMYEVVRQRAINVRKA
ncbi:MAG: 23S rRNA (guanosine(2251)-2'-O)-methyltransferase RlmB [Eubacteriales bacterium]